LGIKCNKSKDRKYKMAKKKKKKEQTPIYKKPHRKPQIEQYEHLKILG
jgi:hypothetical protein